MVSKTQWRVISIVLAIVLLLAAFMTGATGITDGIKPIGDVRKDYTLFKANLDNLEDNEKTLSEGKAQYDEQKTAYDEQKAQYDSDYADYEAANAKYNEDVLGYNQQLIAYSVGKDQLGSGALGAIAQGRTQLDSGWTAYNDGKAAYESGKAEFEAKKQEYEQGKAAYEQLMSGIKALEDKYIPHKLALKIVSAKAGMDITDESLAQMKSQLDMAGSMIQAGEAQLAEGQQQLDSAYTRLQQGEAGLSQAEAQVNSAQAQLNSMKGEIDAGPDKLDADGKAVSDMKAQLDAQKQELDGKAEELSVYETVQEKVERARETLIDEGYGTAESTVSELLDAARVHERELHGQYLKTLISFIVTYGAHILAVIAAAAALILLTKGNAPLAQKLAWYGAALGAVSVIASLIYGSIDTLAFAAAVLSAVGVGLSISQEE